MRWTKGKGADVGQGIELVGTRDGLIVSGPSGSVDRFLTETLGSTGAAARVRRISLDGLATAAGVAATASTHGEYVRLSPASLKLLQANHVFPTGDGYFHSLIHDGRGIVGNITWKPVDLGPEQLMSLQATLAHMALRAAIKDVREAVERVEDKVDQLMKLARAERLGAAMGDRATLHPLVRRMHETGAISTTDWSTVASLGALIARDIESLRAYVALELRDFDDGFTTRSRAAEAEELSDHMVKESLALLVVVEHNYALWQQLRVAHTAKVEPEAIARTAQDVQHQLTELSTADQTITDLLVASINRLLEPTGLEGFAPIQRHRLKAHGAMLKQTAEWFADQRNLDLAELHDHHLPGVVDSARVVGGVIGDGAEVAAKAITSTASSLARRVTERSGKSGAEDPEEPRPKP